MSASEVAYKCSRCGAPVTVRDGVIVRKCLHVDAAVDAHLTATVSGEALVASDKK